MMPANIKPVIVLFAALMCGYGFAQTDQATVAFKGDRAGHNTDNELLTPDEIPPAPILTVEQSIAAMQVAEGFVVEPVVAEPNVFNPVAMAFDAKGRLWVCEMTRFMPDVYGTGESLPEGNIAILEDTDGDGSIDSRSVFISDAVLPRAIAMVPGGILYADNQQLYFAEVLEGEQGPTLGFRDVVDATYAEKGNVEHKANGLLYGIDNWYYSANTQARYQIVPLDEAMPEGGEEIYRNQYWILARGKSDYRGQWGISQDDFGRLYHNGNNMPLRGEYLLPNSLLRNSGFWPKMDAHEIGSKDVYPARVNPGVNRGYLPYVLHQAGPDKGKLIQFTAASGGLIYRGSNFPSRYYGLALTPEPAGNLITARYAIEEEGYFTGAPLYDQQEIVASLDERFRPVNLYNAPDGSVYILDMYHGIIQHKEFLTSYLGKQIRDRDLDKNNNTMGRIYRLRWREATLQAASDLSEANTEQLVNFLSHPNSWQRQTARRILVQERHSDAVRLIRKQLKRQRNETPLINLLWTLHGLKGVDYATVKHLLNHDSEKVRAAVMLIAPQAPAKKHSKIVKRVIKQVPQSYFVAVNSALNSQYLETDDALNLAKVVLDHHKDKPYTKEAVVSGLGAKSAAFMAKYPNYPDSTLQYYLNNLGKDPKDKNNRDQLSEQGVALYDRGQNLYHGVAACSGCHGADGDGKPSMGPTFWESEWVVGEQERLAKVLLHGLSGPIWIKKYRWETSMVMPGYANHPLLSDEDLAAISTYIRNTWGNNADTDSAVDPALFTRVRLQTKQQENPYTQKDF